MNICGPFHHLLTSNPRGSNTLLPKKNIMRLTCALPVIFLLSCSAPSPPAAGPTELPIQVVDNGENGSLSLWHLYEREHATAVVGNEITFVGRVEPGKTEIQFKSPPWLTVAFSAEKKPGDGGSDTCQEFTLQSAERPHDLDAIGFAEFTGKVQVNRPELSSHEKYDKGIPVFRIALTRAKPIHCAKSPEQLLKDAVADLRQAEPRLRELCKQNQLEYAPDESKFASSWYQGCIACTTILSKHPGFSFAPVPYATISVLYNPETGKPARFIFMRRIWQDPRD